MLKVIRMMIKNIEPTIASSLLVQYAKDKRVSVKELAERTGLSYSHISNILSGVRTITPKNEKKLCSALKLTKEEQYALKEAIFISNKSIVISTKNKRDYILKLLYWVTVKSNTLSLSQVEKCIDIIRYGKHLEKD